jgi:hypothetical protein
MGIDATILCAANTLHADRIADIAREQFDRETAPNLAILLADETAAPTFIKTQLPRFTALSVWADNEIDLRPLAIAISRILKQKLIAITMADHACVGGWQIFDDGEERDSYWTAEEDYSTCGIRGIETAFNVALNPPDDHANVVEQFLDTTIGICVRSTTSAMQSGCSLSADAIQQILEGDLAHAEIECVLFLDEDA